jgi:hypothetical protein
LFTEGHLLGKGKLTGDFAEGQGVIGLRQVTLGKTVFLTHFRNALFLSPFILLQFSSSLFIFPSSTQLIMAAPNGTTGNDFTVKAGLAQMLKGGVIMDVVNAEQV